MIAESALLCPYLRISSHASSTSLGSRSVRYRRQSATTDLTEIPQMRLNVRNVQSRRNIGIVARWWLEIDGGHHFLVVVVLIDVIDGHGDVVA